MFFDKNSDAAKYIGTPDRISSNGKLGGFDNKQDGTTTWFNKDGSMDCVTKTPKDDKANEW